MNISSSVNLPQSGTQGLDNYGVAVAVKIKEQIKQQGAAVEQLVESASTPDPNSKVGRNLSAYA